MEIQKLASERQLDPADVEAGMNEILLRDTGSTDFIGYMQEQAKVGITFYRYVTDSSSGPTLTGLGVYIYWAIELLVIAGIAISQAWRAAGRPFCETCGTWYAGKNTIGSVNRNASKDFVNALKNGQFDQAKQMYGGPQPLPRTDLEMEFCKTCQTSPVIVSAQRLVRAGRGGRVSRSLLTRGTVSREKMAELLPIARAG
jgi:hypothetical protein